MNNREKQPPQRKNGAATKALKAAAKAGDVGGIRSALAKGAYIDSTGQHGSASALWLAAGNGHFLAVQYLVQQGAIIECWGLNLSPFGKAFRKGFFEIVEYLAAQIDVASEERVRVENNLVEMALDLDEKSSACEHLVFLAKRILKRPDSSALHQACVAKNPEAVKVLLGIDFDLNKQYKIFHYEPEMTPLQCLCHNAFDLKKARTIAKILLDHGADPFVQNKRGQTALNMARMNDCVSLARFLSKAMGEK